MVPKWGILLIVGHAAVTIHKLVDLLVVISSWHKVIPHFTSPLLRFFCILAKYNVESTAITAFMVDLE
jgi:hypothetical protein